MGDSVMRKRLIFAMLCLACPGPAASATWAEAAHSDFRTFYIDLSSIESSLGARQLWVKVVEATVQPGGEKYTISHVRINCATNQMMALSFTKYRSDGQALESLEIPEYQRSWMDAVPESAGEAEIKFACAH